MAAGATTVYTYSASTVNSGFGYAFKGIILGLSSLFALITYPFKSKPLSKGPKDTVMGDAESESSDGFSDFFQEGPGRKILFKSKYLDAVSPEEARELHYRTAGQPTYPVTSTFPTGPINVPITPVPVQPVEIQEVEIDENSLLFNLSSAALRSAANFTSQAYSM